MWAGCGGGGRGEGAGGRVAPGAGARERAKSGRGAAEGRGRTGGAPRNHAGGVRCPSAYIFMCIPLYTYIYRLHMHIHTYVYIHMQWTWRLWMCIYSGEYIYAECPTSLCPLPALPPPERQQVTSPLPPPPTLEPTQGPKDGFFGQPPFKCYLPEVASVGDWLKIWLHSNLADPFDRCVIIKGVPLV